MDILINLAFITVAMFALSYGWGMRGTTIGGEKGAMLPGALMGTLIAIFSGVYIVQENFYVFSALGAIGMYFGGCMTYGETLSLSMSAKPAINMKKGITALFLKGFLWFAVFGAVFSSGVCAVSGIYRWYELLIIFIVTPLLSVAGLCVLNRPINADEVKFPKIYFSKTRKEYWGAMLGIVVALLIINAFKLNLYSVIFTLLCGITGGFGFSFGQGVQIYLKHYAKNSKLSLIRKIVQTNTIDTWKAMECTFGAIGGMGSAIAFILTKNQFKDIVFNIEKNGGIMPLNKTLVIVFFVIWLLLLLIDNLHYFIKKPLNVFQIKKFKEENKAINKEFFKLLFKPQTESDGQEKKLKWYFEVYEFIVYAAIPFVVICFGDKYTASLMSVFVLFWVLVQEIVFEQKEKNKEKLICFSVIGLVIIIVQIVFSQPFSASFTLLLYTLFYEAFTLVYFVPTIISEKIKANNISGNITIKEKLMLVLQNKGFVITHAYFVFAIIITFIIAL